MKTKIDSFLEWVEPILKVFPKIIRGIKLLLGIVVLLWIGDKILDVIYAHVWGMWVLDALFLILLIVFLHRNIHKNSEDSVISVLLLLIGLLIIFSLATLLWNVFVCIGICGIAAVYTKIRKNQKPGDGSDLRISQVAFFVLLIFRL